MIKKEQQKDSDITEIIKILNEKSRPRVLQTDNRELTIYKRGLSKLRLTEDNILVRDSKFGTQVVLPKSMRKTIYQTLHIDMGHIGTEKVYQIARKRVYWPEMEKHIKDLIENSCLCLIQKKPRIAQRAELQSIVSSMPMELITIDFVKLEKGKVGFQYILVLVDHFTRFAQAYVTKKRAH